MVDAAGLFLIALIVNLCAAYLLQRHVKLGSLSGDEHEYWNIATALRHIGFNGVPARRTLPYPLFIAIVRSVVGDDPFRVQLILSAVLSAIPAVVYGIVVRQVDNVPLGRVAGIATALWPPFVSYGASLFSDSFGLLAFLIFLLGVPSPRRPANSSMRFALQWGLAGALLGFAIQTKPQYLLYIPFVPVIATAITTTIRRGFAASSAMILGCALALLPWATYISHREGHLILVSANGGETIAGGLNPALMTMSRPVEYVTPEGRETWFGPGKWLLPSETGYLSTAELALPYVQMSELLGQRARRWIFTHPRDVAYLSARKLLYMWGIYPFWNGWAQTLFGNVPLLGLLALAIAGLSSHRAEWRGLAVFWTLPIFCSGVALASWGSWRFRMPADVAIFVLAALSGQRMIARLRARSQNGPRKDAEPRIAHAQTTIM